MASFGCDISGRNPHPLAWRPLFTFLRDKGRGAQPFLIVNVSQAAPETADAAEAKAAGFLVATYQTDDGDPLPGTVNSHLRYLAPADVSWGFPDGGGIWLAEHNKKPGVVSVPDVAVHQYTDAGTVPGCEGTFCLDVWTGSPDLFSIVFGVAGAEVAGDGADHLNAEEIAE